ncbi:MAG TPA: hypothetical protein GXX22_06700 [Clostridiales bacterium]|nr:hypothetical protein [Clostridiales bacterium]
MFIFYKPEMPFNLLKCILD